ncbi:MAG TPA: hypothetical protein VHW06_21160 [Streptosporangiaceae bacterium]|jgi:hypothetical protein|nr:hypothetical protein [Streptosporangiaceae bacterium]
MTAIVTPPGPPASSNGHRGTGPASIASLATRHLCAVTHMRTSMLAANGLDADDVLPTPRRWVGRLYSLHVLVDRQFGPMPGVDLGEVKRHCWRAIRQTLIRDAFMLGVVAAAAWLAPWGTLFLSALIAVIIALAGRIKLYHPFVIAVGVGVIVALIAGGPGGEDPFTYPLLAIAACFLIYLADTFWAIRRMRAVIGRVPRPAKRRKGAASSAGPANPALADQFAAVPLAGLEHAVPQSIGHGPGDQSNGHGSGPAAFRPRRRVKALYTREGIVGAGTPLTAATITVAVNKPQKDKEIEPFTAPELLDQVASHIESQGTIDQNRDGFARNHVFIEGKRISLDIPAPRKNGGDTVSGDRQSMNQSFTYGLPELDVTEVVATPARRVRKRPLWWKVTLYICAATWRTLRRTPSGSCETEEVPVPDQSPSAFPARFYVRASTTTWDGELIPSVYVGAVLQAHYLRLIIRPYVLAPIMPQLRQIEHLMDRGIIAQFALAALGTAKTFARTAVTAHKISHRKRLNKREHLKETGLFSTRERYAMYYPDDVHHREDVARVLGVIEMKIFEVAEDFLDQHHVNLEDFRKQIQVFIEKSMVITGGQNSGNFSAGDNNTQQNSSAGSAKGQGSGK